MRWRSKQMALTLLAGAVLLGTILLLVDLLAADVFLALFMPFVVLGLSRLRPIVHWTLFAVIAAATVMTLLRIEASESSTAGFGVVLVPLLLSVGVVLAAVLDRFVAALSTKAS
jgi:hypothetical protein